MDGENAWEHYRDNGSEFLALLYRRLSSHAELRLTTFGEVVATFGAAELPPVEIGRAHV